MVNLKIDGKDVQIEKGATILAAAEKAGVQIPTLCFLKKISPTGSCRVCVVEVAGADQPMTACNTPAVEGMAITTQSPRIARIRRQVVQMLLVNHPLDCPVCDAGGECDLQDVCYDLDINRQPYVAEDLSHPVINTWPLIQQVPSRCILCEKCVKVCHEVVGASALELRERGDKAFIDTVDGKPLDCEFCGNCVAVCPTGTLLSKPFLFKARPWELTRKASVCTQCGSQCQIDYNVKEGRVYRVTSEDGVTVNDGNLCIGASFGYGYINSDQRLKRPLVREADRFREAGWDEALGAVADRIRKVRESSGPQSLAGLGSPRLTNEENYLFQKLFRAAIGSNNIDSEARYGALRVQKALGASLGLQGASNPIDRIGRAAAVMVFGSDVTAEAPAIDWQIEKACRKNDGKLLVANMRRVKLARYANTFLQYRPGTEVALANALSRLLLDLGLADEAFLGRSVSNLAELKAALAKVDLEAAVRETGIDRALLEEGARYLGEASSVALVFGGDVAKGEGAEAKVAALSTLAMVSGALHGDLGGIFPVDEKGNMQGLLDMGVFPESLPGHQPYAVARAKFEKAWGVKLPEGGRDLHGILEGIEKGEVKFLYLAATNPLVTFPDSGRWRRALEKVEFLVVQDILPSEVTRLAHVVLPGVSPAEKTGSVTSLDHRVSCLGQAISPVGEAREDWQILADLYDRLSPRGVTLDTEKILAEMKSLVPLYTEVCFAGEGRCRPCQKAPYRPADKSLTFVPAEAGAAAQGMQLLTGKILFHFGTTTTFAEGTLEVAPEGYVVMNPEDAKALGLGAGVGVRVKSSQGSAQGKVKISAEVPQGLLFAPYHFSDVNIQQVLPAGTNRVQVEVAKI